ncbi:MAG: hypothetical protein IVW53_04600 [Chloroflexi bacterium]|nr:hypothetical protein [Chloroflexota bacterium]
MRELDSSRTIPNPFAELGRNGTTISVVSDDPMSRTHLVIATRRGRRWWIGFPELPIRDTRVARGRLTEHARAIVSEALGVDPSSFNLEVRMPALAAEPPIGGNAMTSKKRAADPDISARYDVGDAIPMPASSSLDQ